MTGLAAEVAFEAQAALTVRTLTMGRALKEAARHIVGFRGAPGMAREHNYRP